MKDYGDSFLVAHTAVLKALQFTKRSPAAAPGTGAAELTLISELP